MKKENNILDLSKANEVEKYMIIREKVKEIDGIITLLNNFKITDESVTKNGVVHNDVINKDDLKLGLSRLIELNIQVNNAKFLNNLCESIFKNDSNLISASDTPKIKECIARIVFNLIDIKKELLSVLPDIDETTVIINLDYSDIKGYTECSKGIKTIFLYLDYFKDLKGKLTFKGVANGSEIIYITLGSIAAIKLFIDILNCAMKLKTKWLYQRKLTLEIENLKEKLNIEQNRLDDYKHNAIKNIISAMAEEIYSVWKEKKENKECVKVISLALETILSLNEKYDFNAELTDKSPKEYQKAMKDINTKLGLIPSKPTKKITSKGKNNRKDK